jgi:hypothetical protein
MFKLFQLYIIEKRISLNYFLFKIEKRKNQSKSIEGMKRIFKIQNITNQNLSNNYLILLGNQYCRIPILILVNNVFIFILVNKVSR